MNGEDSPTSEKKVVDPTTRTNYPSDPVKDAAETTTSGAHGID